jgi:hypothetical protein
LHGRCVSDLSKSAQADVTTIGTFNQFAGDDPTDIVFFAAGWKKQTPTLKGDFHFSYSSAIEGISDHVIFPSSVSPEIFRLNAHFVCPVPAREMYP